MSLWILAIALASSSNSIIDEPTPVPEVPVSYEREVLPILRQNCLGCHQPARAKGKLDLLTHSSLLLGGRGGPVVIAGQPEESSLIELIRSIDGEPPEMPVDGTALAEAQVELLARWVREGALDDSSSSPSSLPSVDNPPVYPRPPVITSLDHSPDGAHLAVSGYNEVLIWTHDGSELIERLIGLSERIESIAFSPDGSLLAVTGGTPGISGELQVWKTAPWKLSLSIPVTHDTVHGASWSPDGELVALGGADNSLRAFDVETGEQILYQGAHTDWVLCTTFSSDGSHLASVGRDRSLKLTKVATQQFIDNVTSITPGVLKGGLMAIERHPERDELLVGGADGAPKLYRMYREKKRVIGDDYNLIRAYEGLEGRVFDVAWSQGGKHLAAASSHRLAGEAVGAVRVYDTEKELGLWTYPAPTGLYALDFHPQTGAVVVGGADGLIRLLDLESGELRHQFSPFPSPSSDIPEEMGSPIEASSSARTEELAPTDSKQQDS